MPNPHHELQRAGAALRSGQPKIAIGICEKLLTERPRHVEARHLRGRCWAALGRMQDAVTDFRRVLSDQNDFFPAWVDLGITEALRGNVVDGRAALERAAAMDSRPAEVHFGLGLCALQAHDDPRAIAAFHATLQRNPQFPDAFANLGVAYERQGELVQALECFRRAVALHPDSVDALRNLGNLLQRQRHDADAAAVFGRAADLRPQDSDVLAEYGGALLQAGNFPAATVAFERALELEPANAAAHLGLGRLASRAGNSDSALRHVTTAGEGAGATPPALAIAIATDLEALGSAIQALGVLDAAAQSHPQSADVQDAMGALQHRLGRLPQALDCYERALALDEQRLQTWINSGNALESLGALRRAIENFERGLTLEPANAPCQAGIVSCAYRLCDWDLAARALATLRATSHGIDALQPFLLLASDLQPREIADSQARRAQAARWPDAGAPSRRSGSPDRLRVAYLSPDFRTHAVAYAIAGVIEHHDRGRVSPIAVSLMAGDGSPMERRLRGAFDEFIDVAGRPDDDVVRLLRERHIDIAIDLAGLTSGARPSIFASRVAPVQVNYLGYPGSTGMGFMDFIVADLQVVPPGDESFYAERVLRMPGSYLPFDDSRRIDELLPARADAGLPPDGFVFCAFTSPFKITRAVFTIWMELLRETAGSVLWLRGMGAEAAAQLKSAARTQRVDPNRLVFAVSLESMTAHLSRLRLADLYLDTVPYNAHTTAAEALWAGVPVITCRGCYFAGRVGASLLSACGMEELICGDLATYRTLALQLAREPDRLRQLRHRLTIQGSAATVFDTRQYTRHFEDLLFRMQGA